MSQCGWRKLVIGRAADCVSIGARWFQANLQKVYIQALEHFLPQKICTQKRLKMPEISVTEPSKASTPKN